MKEDQSQADWAIIARYLDGECADGEVARARELVGNDPALLRLMEARNLSSDTATAPQWDVSSAVGKILEKGKAGKRARVDQYSYKILSRWVRYSAIAACCVLGFASWQVFQDHFGGKDSVPEAKIYTTKPGQRASLTLTGGSRVTLGPLTTIRVQKVPASNSGIIVEVNGEALFNIQHSAKVPFIVTAHGVTTRVLGTEFIVRAYDASLVRVAVRDGKVSVQSPVFTSANVAIVNAGEAVSATPNTLPVVTPIADMATDFAWANGELTLQRVRLGEALVRLSRWYGMEFRVTDPTLLESMVSGVFPSAFDQTDVELLSTAIRANVTRSGNVFTFSAKP